MATGEGVTIGVVVIVIVVGTTTGEEVPIGLPCAANAIRLCCFVSICDRVLPGAWRTQMLQYHRCA